MENAIKKSIEGGWKFTNGESILEIDVGGVFIGEKVFIKFFDKETEQFSFALSDILLDHLFWQALGKQQGWGKIVCANCNTDGWTKENECRMCSKGGIGIKTEDYKYHWHNFIDHIAQGGNIDEFFNNLLK